MTRRTPLPVHIRGSAFLVRETEFHEATPGRLRASDLQRPFTGVRSVGLDLGEVIDRCRAFSPLLRPGEAFSHATAAELLGLPLPSSTRRGGASGELRALHVIAPPGTCPTRTRGAVGHRSDRPVPVIIQHGLPIVDPPLLWCQLAADLSREDLVAVGDALVTGPRRGGIRRAAHSTPTELSTAVDAWGARRGSRRLRWALPRVRIGAESRPESHTRLLVIAAGLPEPVINQPIAVAEMGVIHPDLAYPEWRIALEYEGDGHRTDRRAWQADIRRHRALAAAGWTVIRVTADDVFADSEQFIARIRQHIALAGG
ncbi:hypothetical protein J2X63_003720 [Agromyces sp. 3263]|uniref:endonuclease domain-containing protein n=1 Tax=Agromyces sp. 3263 TaxID=2817750 RepID=UPI002858FD88|nr:DUF559 domain-containing protein [Agromyces sp. 3263]MDR6908012.1 hypothetical protein [Agromyces sp. 3263]